MKIATLLQNKHDSVQSCPFTAPESFSNIVDKKHVISIKHSCVVLCHMGFHRTIVDFMKIAT